MTKTPEDTLKELEAIAEQSRRDADLVKAYIELQNRLGAKPPKISDNQKTESTTNGLKKRVGRPISIEDGNVKQDVIKYILEANKWVKSEEIKKALASKYPNKTTENLSARVRDVLTKNLKKDPRFSQPRKVKGIAGLFYGKAGLE